MARSSQAFTTVPDTQTVLYAAQDISLDDLSPSLNIHPFAVSPHTSLASLRHVIEITNRVSQSLNAHLSFAPSDSKTISLFKQYTSIAHNVHLSERTMHQTVDSLRKRASVTYGENIPLDRTLIIDWCMSRLGAWGTSAGMETFKEEEREGRMTVVLGGKVLVVDIDFIVDRSSPEAPKLDIANVKTSYAVPNGATSSTTNGSTSLDGFLAQSFRAFLLEVQKDEEAQDTDEAARLGSLITEHLKYLMRLDQLALREGENGLRWFTGIDRLAADVLEPFATKEAEFVSTSLSATQAPLDIFLMRAHSLPLPYLTHPAISFLIHLSPLAYLSVLRTSTSVPSATASSMLPSLNIPFHRLRSLVASHPRLAGATIATLLVRPSTATALSSDTISMHSLASRPTFPLVPAGTQIDYTFSESVEPPGSPEFGTTYGAHLDFTDGGRYPGVVMSQSRMREIELIINPLSGIDNMNSMPIMAFGGGSWVDLLLNPSNPTLSPERYTALYTSPTSTHPPLQLRLASPEEPGFLLERVPVRSLKQVWGILEIVREQCWLNEILNSCTWVPEAASMDDKPDEMNEEATEADLQAVLGGTITPRKLPVNVYLPSEPAHDPLFDTADLDTMTISQSSPQRQTKIVMTSPERPPITGLVEITVAYDATRPRGLALSINGAMGADLNIDTLEEVCRRGGVLGLPGRIWSKSHRLV